MATKKDCVKVTRYQACYRYAENFELDDVFFPSYAKAVKQVNFLNRADKLHWHEDRDYFVAKVTIEQVKAPVKQSKKAEKAA